MPRLVQPSAVGWPNAIVATVCTNVMRSLLGGSWPSFGSGVCCDISQPVGAVSWMRAWSSEGCNSGTETGLLLIKL